MRKKYIPFLVLGAAMMVSCGKQIPEDIIQPAEMEELLYDYHLALSLGYDVSNLDNVTKEGMKDYALKKHKVTREDFDSSMVWYTRNASFLHEIYVNLEKRYLMAENRMKTQINKRSGQIEISLSGDSVDVWSDRDLYWLSNSTLTNKVTFNLKADTTFKPLDALSLEANFTFFSPDQLLESKAVVGLNFTFKNDSTQSLVQTVTTSGKQSFYLKADSAFTFESVTGFIYCASTDSVSGDVLVNDIRLMRYHDKGDNTAASANEGASADRGNVRASDRKSRITSGNLKNEKLQMTISK